MIEITIYASDTLVTPNSNSECLASTVTALGDLVTKTFEVLGAYKGIEHEGEEYVGLGYRLAYSRRDRSSYNIPLMPIATSSFATTYSNLQSIFAKEYQYIKFNSELPYSIVSSASYVKAVNGITVESIDTDGSNKLITLTCKDMELNG